MKRITLYILLMAALLHAADQAAGRVGEFIDPENLHNIRRATQGAEAAKGAKEVYDAKSKTAAIKDKALKAAAKYQQSKNGMMYWIKRIQKSMSRVIRATQNKVNKWRTTLPRLKSYTRQTEHLFGGTYSFMKTFEFSDLWDIDRQWSKEFEWRLKKGERLGLSIWDYLHGRVHDREYLESIYSAFVVDYQDELNSYAPGEYHLQERVSAFDKRVFFVQDEAFTTLHQVKKLAEEEFSPSRKAPALTRQAYKNRQLKNLLYDEKSSFTDQAALHQDILSSQYEVSVKRSRLKDELANLDLLWGSLAARKMETGEMQKANSVNEFKRLGRFEDVDVREYMRQKFGDLYDKGGEG